MTGDIASIINWEVMGNAGCGIKKYYFVQHSLVFLQKMEQTFLARSSNKAISFLLLFLKNVSGT